MRKLKLTLTPKGAINRFYAFVDGKRVIAADGTKAQDATVDVADEGVILKVRVWGIDDAGYEMSVDLPGTASDQKLELKLAGGYHECELSL